jgi:hypothetical protein
MAQLAHRNPYPRLPEAAFRRVFGRRLLVTP